MGRVVWLRDGGCRLVAERDAVVTISVGDEVDLAVRHGQVGQAAREARVVGHTRKPFNCRLTATCTAEERT